MSSDDDKIRDELARHFVDALAALYAQVWDASVHLDEREVLERLAPIVHLVDEERARVLANVAERGDAAFAVWVSDVLDRFPAIPSRRSRWTVRFAS